MLAHILLNYDVKMALDGQGRPANWVFGITPVPDRKAEVMLAPRLTGMQQWLSLEIAQYLQVE